MFLTCGEREQFRNVAGYGFWKEEPRKAKDLLDRRHNSIDRNKNRKGHKTCGEQERMTGTYTIRQDRSVGSYQQLMEQTVLGFLH